MGTALFNQFGMDLASLFSKITPNYLIVWLALRTTAMKTYIKIETAQTMLRQLEDLMTSLLPGAAGKGEPQQASWGYTK